MAEYQFPEMKELGDKGGFTIPRTVGARLLELFDQAPARGRADPAGPGSSRIQISACPNHSWSFVMSAWWESAFVAAVARRTGRRRRRCAMGTWARWFSTGKASWATRTPERNSPRAYNLQDANFGPKHDCDSR